MAVYIVMYSTGSRVGHFLFYVIKDYTSFFISPNVGRMSKIYRFSDATQKFFTDCDKAQPTCDASQDQLTYKRQKGVGVRDEQNNNGIFLLIELEDIE